LINRAREQFQQALAIEPRYTAGFAGPRLAACELKLF